ADNAQEDRRAVKADPPAERGEDKSSANHAPPIKGAHALQRVSDGATMLRCGPKHSRSSTNRMRAFIAGGRLMASNAMFAQIAALAGDPARAGMLHALMDGRALTASELARVAGIAPQTASGHLARMAAGGLLGVEQQGRHRYHRLGLGAVA